MIELRRKILNVVILIFLIVVLGTAGYMAVEGWDFLDALYMTVTTLSTVGFQEVHALSVGGRVFTILLIVAGVGSFFYCVTAGAQVIMEGEILKKFGR
ncbi:MAG TPA: potassium channel family protein, partial [Thermodesulfobacteriota bacterium]|nr:potassium channel family protein [Thermodesulfobacteriota bacterium]